MKVRRTRPVVKQSKWLFCLWWNNNEFSSECQRLHQSLSCLHNVITEKETWAFEYRWVHPGVLQTGERKDEQVKGENKAGYHFDAKGVVQTGIYLQDRLIMPASKLMFLKDWGEGPSSVKVDHCYLGAPSWQMPPLPRLRVNEFLTKLNLAMLLQSS